MEFSLTKRNKKETKVWHWLLVDIVFIATWFIARAIKSMLAEKLGGYSWLVYPGTYLVMFIILAAAPFIPSGIRSRYRYVMIRTVLLLIALTVFLGIEIPKMEQNIETTTENFLNSLVS